MSVSSPISAFGAPPERGLSTQRRPFAVASAASCFVASGSIDDMSMISVPAFAPSTMPASPKTALRTTAGELRLRMT
jgi:hypothetical protein